MTQTEITLYYIDDLQPLEVIISKNLLDFATSQNIKVSELNQLLKTPRTRLKHIYKDKNERDTDLTNLIKLNNSSFIKEDTYRCIKCNHTVDKLSRLISLDFKCTGCEKLEQTKKIEQVYNIIAVNAGVYQLECKTCFNKEKQGISDLKSKNYRCISCENKSEINELENNNYTVINNPKHPLEVQCNICNHIEKIHFSTLKKRKFKCIKCEENKINELAHKQNFSVLMYSPIKVQCNICGTHKTTKLGLLKKVTCIVCSDNKHKIIKPTTTTTTTTTTIVKQVTPKQITPYKEKEIIEKTKQLNLLGYNIISKNVSNDLEVQCIKCEHKFKRPYKDFNRGRTSCPNCIINSYNVNKVKFLVDEGYKILSDMKDVLSNPIKVECKNKHIFNRTLFNFERMSSCLECQFNEKDEIITSLGYKIKHKDAVYYHVECENNHVFKRPYYDFVTLGVTQCLICNPYSSSQEKKIHSYLDSLGIKYEVSNWNLLENGQEIDIYVPEFNLAIEVNGVCWHSELKGKDRKYHLNKQQICTSKGINLIQPYDIELNNVMKEDIWKSIISSKLQLNKKIYARKCIIKEVDSNIATDFFNENHLQGHTYANMCVGLYYDGELVSLMSFNKARYNNNYDWELIRYANKKYINIVGGASKLLKYFRKHNVGSVISYADKRHSSGKLYEKLGFTLTHSSEPNYKYFKEAKNLESREKYQKHKLPNILENFNVKLTEWENMKNNGYNRIWDCGNYVYELL